MHRMRQLAIALATTASLATVATRAAAQEAKVVRFGVSGGLSLPMGDLGKSTDAGYVIAGHLWAKPNATKALSFRGDVSFDQWNFSNGADASWKALGFLANGIFEVPTAKDKTAQPYLLAGVGLFSQRYTLLNRNYDDSDVAIQAGGGLTFRLSGFDTFVEAKVVNVFATQSSTWVPITFGVRF